MGPNLDLLLPSPDGQRRILSSTISLSIAAMVIMSLILAGVGLYGAIRESDAVSVERQARTALHSMEASVDDLALQQETVAIWDDSAAHLVPPRQDPSWIHMNIGEWLYKIFGHDEVFILDGVDRPIYASTKGALVSTERYVELASELDKLVGDLRLSGRGHVGVHDRKAGWPLHPKTTVRTTTRPTHASHIILVGGRPAAASAMLMQPSTPNYVGPVLKWPILISVRYIDDSFLRELGARQLIASPRFSPQPPRLRIEHGVPLRTEWGTTIGFLVWQPELPGTRIIWNLVPLNLLIFMVLSLFMALLGRRLSKAANNLSDAEARSAHLACHDSLTGLPNRTGFQRELDAKTNGEGHQPGFSLVLLDVDEFKAINDTLGHDAGDAVLVAFAKRLKRSVRSEDLVARLGGDEFALILKGMQRDDLEAYCHLLLERLREPLEYRGAKIHGRASIGVSSCAESSGAADLLKHADLALYEAKASGGGSFRMYDPIMWSGMLLRQEMLSVAQAALSGDFIRPYYQPKVDLATGAVVGFEALLRCCLPGLPAKGPECLSAAFEDTDLAAKLSDRIIDGVIADIIAWRAADLSFGHVAINTASCDLRSSGFAERLLAKLDYAGVPAELIQLEITESVLLGRGIDDLERTFSRLAARGIRLALDDFGTGFASLTHLKRFPIEIIKIDRSFVRDLQLDADDGVIVDALIGLGRALQIEVVAEGIETIAQRDFLCALGCPTGQGYLFGHAMPGSSIPEMLSPFRAQFRAAA